MPKNTINFIAEIASCSYWDDGTLSLYDSGCGCCADGGEVTKEEALLLIQEQIKDLQILHKRIEEEVP